MNKKHGNGKKKGSFNKSQSVQQQSDKVCYNCRGLGHYARNCTMPRNVTVQPLNMNVPPQHVAAMSMPLNHYSYVAATPTMQHAANHANFQGAGNRQSFNSSQSGGVGARAPEARPHPWPEGHTANTNTQFVNHAPSVNQQGQAGNSNTGWVGAFTEEREQVPTSNERAVPFYDCFACGGRQ